MGKAREDLGISQRVLPMRFDWESAPARMSMTGLERINLSGRVC